MMTAPNASASTAPTSRSTHASRRRQSMEWLPAEPQKRRSRRVHGDATCLIVARRSAVRQPKTRGGPASGSPPPGLGARPLSLGDVAAVDHRRLLLVLALHQQYLAVVVAEDAHARR